jgi:peptide-methionine (S)-S-oxide reductase
LLVESNASCLAHIFEYLLSLSAITAGIVDINHLGGKRLAQAFANDSNCRSALHPKSSIFESLPAANWRKTDMTVLTGRAVLAGGCFWGLQDLLRRYPGVISTRVGYTGGEVPNATYRNHGNHAEAIEIIFDPEVISYRQLLEVFFQIHDPSTLNRQGNDVGASYRSAIFYASDEQKRIAQDTAADIDASGLWPGKVVTEIVPVGPFWEAEPEHQDYLERYPNGYTCHFVRPDWKLPRRRQFGEAIRTNG